MRGLVRPDLGEHGAKLRGDQRRLRERGSVELVFEQLEKQPEVEGIDDLLGKGRALAEGLGRNGLGFAKKERSLILSMAASSVAHRRTEERPQCGERTDRVFLGEEMPRIDLRTRSLWCEGPLPNIERRLSTWTFARKVEFTPNSENRAGN